MRKILIANGNDIVGKVRVEEGIKTPYGIKNWSYIKRLLDQDMEGNKVSIEVIGGVAHLKKCPSHIEVNIIDED